MPPKKRLEKELSVEGPSPGTRAQALEATQATTQQQISSVPPQATIEVGRPEEPPQQPPRQVEVLTPPHQPLSTQINSKIVKLKENQSKNRKKR
jgi:hypothetical protein